MRLALLLISLLVAGCDKAETVAAATPDAGTDPGVSRVHQATGSALRAEGTVRSKGGEQLQWRQGLSAGVIEDLVGCGDRLYARSGGRVVEWEARTHAPKRVLEGFGAVTSLDADADTLLAGTADGRLIRSSCEGGEPRSARETGLPIHLVLLDPRSETRAFVAYEEAPTKANKLNGAHATVGLVDIKTGKFVRSPFQTPLPDDSRTRGFADYRGQLFFGLTPAGRRTKLWSLERFAPGQPTITGLGEANQVHGFHQKGREVWAYGGPLEGGGSSIYRVDTTRAKPMWDGKEAWFGEQPGGDLPKLPITFIQKRKKEVLIGTTAAVYAADPELRRWRILEGNDPQSDVMATATRAVSAGKTTHIGTAHGLIAVEGEGWERYTVPPTAAAEEGEDLVQTITWAGRNWVATSKGLQVGPADSERLKKHKGGPRKNVHGMFVDASSRLWVFADDGSWMLENGEKLSNTKWETDRMGMAPSLVRSIADGPEGSLVVTTSQDLTFRIRTAPAGPKD